MRLDSYTLRWLSFSLLLLLAATAFGQQERLTVVEYNVENLFDCTHDTLKNDIEFTPDGTRHWSHYRYWQKLNHIGQAILSCGEDSGKWALPDIVALCEVENDTVMYDLTRRSLLRKAHYDYVMTDSPDLRGIDVALLYSPFSFHLINHYPLRVRPLKDMKPTRDILYVSGELITGDTIHVFVVHAPSRSGGEHSTRPYRLHVARRLVESVDSIHQLSPDARIIALGDFNDYADDASLCHIYVHGGMRNVSKNARGSNGAKGTYRYRGEWGSLDQILVSESLSPSVYSCSVHDAPFLIEEDPKYGGVRPKRFFIGYHYNDGYSDHLPLVLKLMSGRDMISEDEE